MNQVGLSLTAVRNYSYNATDHHQSRSFRFLNTPTSHYCSPPGRRKRWHAQSPIENRTYWINLHLTPYISSGPVHHNHAAVLPSIPNPSKKHQPPHKTTNERKRKITYPLQIPDSRSGIDILPQHLPQVLFRISNSEHHTTGHRRCFALGGGVDG